MLRFFVEKDKFLPQFGHLPSNFLTMSLRRLENIALV
jgi:hypothetical protein